MRRSLFAGILATGLLLPAFGQKKGEILVDFAGVLKSITARHLLIEPEEGNDIRFLRTRRTRFLDGKGKAVSELEFKVGDAISVEAVQKLNTDLEAIHVRHAAERDPGAQ